MRHMQQWMAKKAGSNLRGVSANFDETFVLDQSDPNIDALASQTFSPYPSHNLSFNDTDHLGQLAEANKA